MPETAPPLWHLYVIRTVDGFLYTGITTDVERRFAEHMSDGRKAAKYLVAHRPDRVVFSRPVGSRSQAAKVEYAFKRLSRADKEAVIAGTISSSFEKQLPEPVHDMEPPLIVNS